MGQPHARIPAGEGAVGTTITSISWDDNDIAIGPVELVSSDATGAVVHVDLRWNGSGPWLTDEFVLRRGSGGELLIAAQRQVGR